MNPPSTATEPARPGRLRRVAAALCLGLPSLAVLAFGGQLLVLGWTDSRPGGMHHVHDVAWGAAEGILLLVALVVVLVDHFRGRPRPAVRQHLFAVVAALLVAMAITARPDPATLVLSALVGTGLWLIRPASVGPRPRGPVSRPVAALAAVAAAALVPYALVAAAAQRAGDSLQAERMGYAGATVWAVAVVAVVLVAAAGARGWRVPALAAAAAVAVVGVASLVWPDIPSSLGSLGGAGALLWAAAVLVVAARPSDAIEDGAGIGSGHRSGNRRAKTVPRSGTSTRRIPGGAAPASGGTSAVR